jgi:hypothetical protein
MKRLWSDEAGFVVSSELVLIATTLVIAISVGMTTVRDQVIQELGDVAMAIASVNQSFSYSGVTAHSSSISGSLFSDETDFCDGADADGAEPACITIDIAANLEGS